MITFVSEHVCGSYFRSDKEVQAAVEDGLNTKGPDFFISGMMTLERRCAKCIMLDGGYIEQEKVDI